MVFLVFLVIFNYFTLHYLWLFVTILLVVIVAYSIGANILYNGLLV